MSNPEKIKKNYLKNFFLTFGNFFSIFHEKIKCKNRDQIFSMDQKRGRIFLKGH